MAVAILTTGATSKAAGYVQGSCTGKTSGTVSSATVPLNPTQAGDVLVVGLDLFAPISPTISDGVGDTFQLLVDAGTAGHFEQIWISDGIDGGATAVTVTLPSSQDWALFVDEYSVGPLGLIQWTSANPNAPPFTTGSFSIAAGGPVLVYVLGVTNVGPSLTLADPPFLTRGACAIDVAADTIVTGPTDIAATFTGSGSGPWSYAFLAFGLGSDAGSSDGGPSGSGDGGGQVADGGDGGSSLSDGGAPPGPPDIHPATYTVGCDCSSVGGTGPLYLLIIASAQLLRALHRRA